MITIEVKDKAVMGLLRKLHKRTGDLTPAMEETGEIILVSVEENFERGGRRCPHARGGEPADVVLRC